MKDLALYFFNNLDKFDLDQWDKGYLEDVLKKDFGLTPKERNSTN